MLVQVIMLMSSFAAQVMLLGVGLAGVRWWCWGLNVAVQNDALVAATLLQVHVHLAGQRVVMVMLVVRVLWVVYETSASNRPAASNHGKNI